MKPVKVDLKEDNLSKLEKRLNRKKLNPWFVIIPLVIVGTVILGIELSGKIKTKPKKIKKPQAKIEIIDLSQIKIPQPKIHKVSKKEKKVGTPLFKQSISLHKTSKKEIGKKIVINRIIAVETSNYKEALRYKKIIKNKFKDTDPWILKKENKYYVIAGSYISESNIKSTVNELKELGLKPRIWKIELKR